MRKKVWHEKVWPRKNLPYKDPVNNWENLKILIIYLFKKFSMQKFELGSLNLQKAEGLK